MFFYWVCIYICVFSLYIYMRFFCIVIFFARRYKIQVFHWTWCRVGGMHVFTHVCMHVCMYVYACMHVFMHDMYMHVCMYVYACMHVCIYMYVCIYIHWLKAISDIKFCNRRTLRFSYSLCWFELTACVRMDACMYECMYMHACMYVLYVCTYACMYVRMHVCMYIHLFFLTFALMS